MITKTQNRPSCYGNGCQQVTEKRRGVQRKPLGGDEV